MQFISNSLIFATVRHGGGLVVLLATEHTNDVIAYLMILLRFRIVAELVIYTSVVTQRNPPFSTFIIDSVFGRL